MRLTWDQALGYRLTHQHLRHRAPADAWPAVASDLLGLHAQVLSSAELTLWARVDDLPRTAVRDALWEDRTLVKQWAMRGTLHLLPSDELDVWQPVLAQDARYERPSWQKAFGVSLDELHALHRDLTTALDGPPLTRVELQARIAEIDSSAHLAEALAGSWGSLIKPAAFLGLLCFGPNQGQQITFTRPDRWLSRPTPPDPFPPAVVAAAEGEVTRRYLRTYGPTRREWFSQWLGCTAARGGRLLAALGDEAVTVDLDGTPAVALAESLDELSTATAERAVNLLPVFDQYVVTAPRAEDAVVPQARKGEIYRPQGWFAAVLLVEGRMAGVWRHERKGSKVVVSIEPFAAKVPAWLRKAATAEAERLATWLGGSLDLTWA